MKFSLPLALLSAFAATTQAAETVQISDLYVDKHEDYLTQRIRIRSVEFTINGFDAKNVRCAASPTPTFPSDILKCDDPKYRFVIAEGDEGSGLQFSIRLYYDNRTTSTYIQGGDSFVTRCYRKTNVDEEGRYDCNQLIPTTISLVCLYRC